MHGLGNDFVFLEAEDVPKYLYPNMSQFARSISDRCTGIGCDQFVIYENLHPQYYVMTIYNIDGSYVKLCGNATRCLAKLIYLKTGEQYFTIKSHNKELKCSITDDDDEVTVNVGGVSFHESWMPSTERIRAAVQPYANELLEVVCVDVGNPHVVLFGTFTEPNLEFVGKMLQDDRFVRDGVNVSFAKIAADRGSTIYLSVWERGAGRTLACGSAACASSAAAFKLKLVETPCKVVFGLGTLKIAAQNDDLLMSGGTTLVASGVYYYKL